ncbi:hypothetical protein PRZ48_013310 [Zasmidium cellare]|uniref:Uncharacterized protein n=1 Tax=Zasmidium cellare TaxID=395010 RepID=A0ABR0E478_ZASCE|nr:hypothetical protein PRZ48_013310 [Zasmidium cellare]
MADSIPESEIWASKNSILLARSQRVLQSWIPSKPSNDQQNEDDEDDFQGTRDSAGLGAVNENEDSELEGILKRKRTDNDKLLEHLIGKKAAEARRKSQKADAGKSMSMSKHAAPKPITSTSSKVKAVSRPEESDDEEEGRAAAFTSKMRRDTKTPAYATAGGQADVEVDPDAEPPDPRKELATVQELEKQNEEQDTKPKRRKVGSYLDEVLGLSGKKGKKKKKKGKGGEGGE